MVRNCCHHCTERVVGCHSTCEKYKKAQAEWETIRKERSKETAIIEHHYKGILKRARRVRFFYSKVMKYKI